jgi:hypothetical protein
MIVLTPAETVAASLDAWLVVRCPGALKPAIARAAKDAGVTVGEYVRRSMVSSIGRDGVSIIADKVPNDACRRGRKRFKTEA